MFKPAALALMLMQGTALAAPPTELLPPRQGDSAEVVFPPNRAAEKLVNMAFDTSWAPNIMRPGDPAAFMMPNGTPIGMVLIGLIWLPDTASQAAHPPQANTYLGGAMFEVQQNISYDDSVVPAHTRVIAKFFSQTSASPLQDRISAGLGMTPASMHMVSFSLPDGRRLSAMDPRPMSTSQNP